MVGRNDVARGIMSAAIECGRGRRIARDRTHTMAILNITGDSFSGDGTFDANVLVARAERALAAGAAILDCGAESTRPGAQPVSAAEEYARLLPAIEVLVARFPEAIFSIDTTKPEIFRAAYAAGAHMLNCVAGPLPEILQSVAACDAALVLCDPGIFGENSAAAVARRLADAGKRAEACGIPPERIIVDPGFGFGKSADENIALLRELSLITRGRYASLLGASRKSTLGKLTRAQAADREFATAATTTIAALAYCDFVRVHDVAAAHDVVAVADAVVRGRRPADWHAH